MRNFIASILIAGLLIPSLAFAQDDSPAGRNLFARLLAALVDNSGEELSGDDNVINTYHVDGNSQVVVIEEIVLNLNLNDVEFGAEDEGNGPPHRIFKMLEGHCDAGRHTPPQHLPGNHPFINRDEFHGERMEFFEHHIEGPRMGRHLRPEIMEMMMGIPEEVDPGFVAWIMEIGELAWTNHEFRERLEMLVEETTRR